jgi:hypothetical protein
MNQYAAYFLKRHLDGKRQITAAQRRRAPQSGIIDVTFQNP